MAKAIIKTTENDQSVDAFIDGQDEQVRDDCRVIMKMMRKATGTAPRMWGGSIVGFGNYLYTSPATGRQVDWFYCGLAPRKANISLYLMPGSFETHAVLLEKLGKHKLGKGCLYIKRLADVDVKVLEKLVDTVAGASIERVKNERGTSGRPARKKV